MKHIYTGNGAPTFTPSNIGAHYIDKLTGNQYLAGGISSAADWKITTSGTYTNEQAMDAVGNILTDTSTVNFTYNDAADQITADVIVSGIDHNSLNNFVANKHIDHSLVSITAGTGLTGGGDITATRSLGIAATGITATSYGSTTQVPVITVNAQGQLTSASNSTIAIPSTSVTDFSEAVDDRVAALVVSGTGITAAYNDPANTLTFTNTDLGSTAVSTHVAAGNPHTQYLLASTAATTYQPLDTDLTGIAALATNGILVKTGSGTASTRTITAGTGITVTNGDGISGNPTIASTITQYTNEDAQDAIGSILTDSASIDLVYNDAGNSISASVIPSGVNHDLLLNYVDLKHVDHSAVSITAGAGLSGGGDTTATRTISMPNVGTAGTYGDASNYPVVTTDTQGRVSAITLQPIGASAGWTEVITTADIIVSSNVTLTNVPQLAFSAVAGRQYYMEYTIRFRTNATTTGFAVTIGTSNTAVGTIACQVNMPIAADGTAALYTGSITSLSDVVTSTGVPTVQPTWFICNVKGIFDCTTSGTIVPQFRSEVNGSNVNFGSYSVALIREFA